MTLSNHIPFIVAPWFPDRVGVEWYVPRDSTGAFSDVRPNRKHNGKVEKPSMQGLHHLPRPLRDSRPLAALFRDSGRPILSFGIDGSRLREAVPRQP